MAYSSDWQSLLAERQLEWSNGFESLIREAIGKALTRTATTEEDIREATDFVVRSDVSRCASRLRTFAFTRFPDDFTLRTKARWGGRTELEKILDGCGDMMFYGFMNKAETELHSWRVFDLHAFRVCYSRLERGKEIKNSDGTCFRPFSFSEAESLSPGFIIKECRPCVMLPGIRLAAREQNPQARLF